MSTGIKDRALNGVAWAMVDTYSRQIVQFLISVILARLLTPTEYGLIGMLAIFMAISSVFIDGGFSSALIQCKDRSEKDLSTVFFINVTTAICIYWALYFSAPIIGKFYEQPILTSILRVYGICLVIDSVGSTSSVQLTVKLDFKTTTKISLISAIISGIIGITLAWSGWGVWALVGQSISSSLVRLFSLFFFVRWYPKAGFSKDSFKHLFSFSSKLFGASIISNIYDNTTGTVIGKQFNAADLAYYNQGQTFNTLVNGNITSVLGRVSYPLLSQIQDDDVRLKYIYERYIQMSAFLTFPALMLLCGIAKPLILFLLTEKWEQAVILIQILSFGFLSDGVIVSNLNLIKVKGRADIFLKLEIIKKGIAFTILGITIAMNSIIAICIGRAIYGGIIALYINTYYTKKLMGYGFKEQFKGFWPYLVISLIMLVLTLIIVHYISNPFISLCISIPIALTLYLYLCSRYKLYAYLETKRILSPFFKNIKTRFIK